MMSSVRSLLFTLIILCPGLSLAQDSLSVNADTVRIQPSHSPRKATIYSAVLPGLGQAYNHKYWKLPIIYGGGGFFVYTAIQNHQEFRRYQQGYIAVLDSDYAKLSQLNFPGTASAARLRAGRDLFRRNRDLSIIGAGVIYILQIVDANVDAHLFNFDVGEKLTLHWRPDIYARTPTAHLSLTFR